MSLATDDQRVDDGGAIAGVGMAYEEPVLRAEFARADGVLDGVGVEASVAVPQMCGEWSPVFEQIGTSVAESGLGQHALLQRRDEPVQPRQWAREVFLPERGTAIADLRFVPFVLELIESPDQAQHALGGARTFAGGLEEASPRSAQQPSHSTSGRVRT